MGRRGQAASLTVGFSQIGSESGWRAAETTVTKDEAKKRGITVKIADAQQKQENQIKAIRSFVAKGSTGSCSPRWSPRLGLPCSRKRATRRSR